MTIAELIKELMDSAKERAKTPIAGSFVLAFLLYNWRPIFLLMFSDASMEDKIVVINNEYCSIGAIFWPFLIAAFYVGVVQYIMLFFDYATTYAYKNRKINRYSRQKHDLESFRAVLKEQRVNEDIRSGNLAIGQLNDEIEKLKRDLDTSGRIRLEIEEKDQETIETLTNDIDNLKHENAILLKEKLKKQSLDEYFYENPEIINVLNRLTEDDKNKFVDFVDFYILDRSPKVVITEEDVNLFSLLKLSKMVNNKWKLTSLGEVLYNYLEFL